MGVGGRIWPPPLLYRLIISICPALALCGHLLVFFILLVHSYMNLYTKCRSRNVVSFAAGWNFVFLRTYKFLIVGCCYLLCIFCFDYCLIPSTFPLYRTGCLCEAFHFEAIGGLKKCWQLFLGHVHLTGVHELQYSL